MVKENVNLNMVEILESNALFWKYIVRVFLLCLCLFKNICAILETDELSQ